MSPADGLFSAEAAGGPADALFSAEAAGGPADALFSAEAAGGPAQGRPTAAELVQAVRDMLDTELRPSLSGAAAFRVRVAVNALGMVERELRGDGGDGSGAAQDLGYVDDVALSSAIRSGTLDDRMAVLRAALLGDVEARLRVAAPRYAAEYEPDDFGRA